MKRVVAVFDRVVDILFYTGCALTFLVFIFVTAEVISRHVSNVSLPWVVDFSEYALVTSATIGAAYVLKKEGHVSIDTVINLLNPGRQSMIISVTSMIGAIVCVILFVAGTLAVSFHFQKGTQMTQKIMVLPMAPLLIVIPLGFFLLLVQFIRRFYGYWSKKKTWQTKYEG